MSDFNLDAVLNVINNAINAVKTANEVIDNFKDAKVVFTAGTSQEEVDAAITKLRTEYEALHEKVQNKLRGTQA